MTPDELIKRVLELDAAATAGPWGIEETSQTAWVGPMRTNGDGKIAVIIFGLPIGDELKPEYSCQNLADSRFIALSRTAAPALARALLDAQEALNRDGTRKQIEIDQLGKQLAAAQADTARLQHAMDIAWGLIANVNGGDWKEGQSPDWVKAAEKWRDEQYYSRACAVREPATRTEGQG